MSYRSPKEQPWSPSQRQALSCLSPIQEEVLWLLVEGASEDVSMVVNQLRHELPGVPDEALISDIEEAVVGMWTSGLITVCRYERGPRGGCIDIPAEEAEKVLSLRDVLEWDVDGEYWRWQGSGFGLDEVSLCVPMKVLDAFRSEHGLRRERPYPGLSELSGGKGNSGI